jgi:hypothetical protein
MLATDTQAPVVSETTVGPDLLQALKVVTHLRVNGIGQDLGVLSVDDILLPVQEPSGDLELSGVLHDSHNALKLIRVEVTGTNVCWNIISVIITLCSPLLEVNIGLLADDVGVSSTNTANLSQRYDIFF